MTFRTQTTPVQCTPRPVPLAPVSYLRAVKPQPVGLSQTELRRLVAEMLG